jgi:hypothetical protein
MLRGQLLLLMHFIYSKFPFKTRAHSDTIRPMEMDNPEI